MAMTCPQCGAPNQPAPGFCAQCGRPLAASAGAAKTVLGMPATGLPKAPAAPPAAPAGPAKTALGMPAMGLPVGNPAPATPPPQAAVPAAAGGAARTVLGMPAAAFLPPTGAAAAPAAAPPGAAAPGDGRAQTMLGVAVPGVAPLNPGLSAAPQPAQPSAVPFSGRASVANEARTMLGVPIPGEVAAAPPPAAAPLVTGMFVGPAPAPPQLEELPAAPSRVVKRGVPLGVVAGGLLALVVGGGAAALILVRGGSPLVIKPRLSPRGADVLAIACDSCPDGTKVSVGGAAAEFKGKQAELELSAPLVVGPNAVALHLDRPGSGRDEDVKATVPVRYRIQSDVSRVGESPPIVRIAVDAEPGTVVKLDGEALALDPQGKGQKTIDLTADCTGMADETRTVEKTVAYEISGKELAERGSVVAKVSVPALRLDAPFAGTVLGSERFTVAGRTIKGATVTVNGRTVTVDATGVFAESFAAPTPTPVPIDVKSSLPSSAPRFVTLKVRRSTELEREARAAQKAGPGAKYDELLADVNPHVGKPQAVEGDLVDLRTTNHQSILLVKALPCTRADGCLVRVLSGAPVDAKAGSRVLVTGRVTRLFSGGKSPVPEIEADIAVAIGKRP